MVIRVKESGGSKYLYYIYYENGKKNDVYCGSESKTESRKKVLDLEIGDLENRKKDLANMIGDMKRERQKLR